MINVKKIIAIQTVALCAIVLLASTPAYASEVTGNLNSSTDPNGQIGGTVGGGSTVSGTISGGSNNDISGTVSGGGGGGGSTVSGTVNNGTGGASNLSGGVSSGGSSGGTTQPYVGGLVLGLSTGYTPALPNTGFGPPDDEANSAPFNSLALFVGLGIIAAFIGYEIVRRHKQRVLQ